MPTTADLTSTATAIEELARRIASIGQEYASEDREEVATELYAIEAALSGASRRLRRISDMLR